MLLYCCTRAKDKNNFRHTGSPKTGSLANWKSVVCISSERSLNKIIRTCLFKNPVVFKNFIWHPKAGCSYIYKADASQNWQHARSLNDNISRILIEIWSNIRWIVENCKKSIKDIPERFDKDETKLTSAQERRNLKNHRSAVKSRSTFWKFSCSKEKYWSISSGKNSKHKR